MNRRVETLYYLLPVWAQSLALSVYGAKLWHERYAGRHSKYYERLQREEFLTKEDVQQLIDSLFLEQLSIAFQTVPFYRHFSKKNSIDIGEFSGVSDIAQLPIITKEMIQHSPSEFVSVNYHTEKLININTSGTSGKPLHIFIDRDSRRRAYSFFSLSKKWAGVEKGNKLNVTFAGRGILPSGTCRPPFWRRNFIFNNYLFSSYHMSPKYLSSYVEKLEDLNPSYIDSYPSSIFTLAKFINDNCKQTSIRPEVIITSSETLLDYQRELIEEVFCCPVYDQYGSAEQVVFISQCEKKRYHIHPQFGYVEFLRDNGERAHPGEMARMICTGFTNRAMPLFRYDIGDTAVLSETQNCTCGRNFPVVEKIIGRTDDTIILPDGRVVGRLDPIFKGISSFIEAQIVQERLDLLTLKIVPGDNFSDNDVRTVLYELSKRIGNQIQVVVEKVDCIERSSSGKFRAVVSTLTR